MIFHKASEERKWKQWKEQEERILRESGVSEGVIQRLRELDWQDFNTERRYWEHFSPNQEELYTNKKSKKSVSLISDICGCGRSYSRILVVLTSCGKKKQYVLQS